MQRPAWTRDPGKVMGIGTIPINTALLLLFPYPTGWLTVLAFNLGLFYAVLFRRWMTRHVLEAVQKQVFEHNDGLIVQGTVITSRDDVAGRYG